MTPVAELYRKLDLERSGYKEAPPPFINGLIAANSSISISKEQFRDIVITADRYQEQLYLDTMNRQVDTTGFVSAFIGICQTPEEVQASLDQIAHTTLERIHKAPPRYRKRLQRHLNPRNLVVLRRSCGLTKNINV